MSDDKRLLGSFEGAFYIEGWWWEPNCYESAGDVEAETEERSIHLKWGLGVGDAFSYFVRVLFVCMFVF